MLIGCFFVFFTILMQVLHWCKVNVFKIVVLLGTFALALAFAGNDLVNFIGVPLAGYSSFIDYTTNGTAAGPDGFLMTSLLGPAKRRGTSLSVRAPSWYMRCAHPRKHTM